MPLHRILSFALSIAALGACAAPRTAPPAATGGQPTGPPDAPAVTMLFDVALSAEGNFRAGEPVRVQATARARLPVDTAELSLVMPEVSAARTSGWGEAFQPLPFGVRYPAVDSVLAPLRPGGEARVGTEVRLPAGYYQVMAHARVRSIDPQVQQSTPMQELASETLWLWIGDEGGYAAREQDQTRYPLRALAQPGPLRMPPAGARMRALLDSALADPQSHAVVTGTVTAANGRPAANVPVQVRAYVDQCPGRGAAEESARTDAAGRFRVRLRSYVPRAFAACVAVHADPPRGSGQGHAALRDVTVGFVPAASRPDSVRVQLRLPAGEGRG